ncbi:alpha/beta hydrolase family protein [Yinghuangia seranimata]|nr:alpha/beta hydrolase family protein [Yinghuangia seranimata]MDI2124769.1 alpha/beta hydrolase family protein [Yinghuangia seranimata]
MAIGAIATALVGVPAAQADTEPAGHPVMASGFGLISRETPAHTGVAQTAYDFTITVDTDQVRGTAMDDGGHHIRIVLPSDYYTNPTKHYPVLYLLNGSSPGSDPATYFNGYSKVDSSSGMIFVMPDGGPRGWYSNWYMQNTPAGAQNWENFHINQVLPFIDANLRTVADKQHRAIAGISMGGFGAVRYAERHPELFSQVASFSGDLDLSRMSMDLREAAVASLVGDALGYTPGVDSDALYGTPYPFSLKPPFSDVLWNDANPGAHAAALRGIGVSFYVGNGGGGAVPPPPTNMPMFFEWWLNGANNHFQDALVAAGVPSHYVNYGDGKDTAWQGCGGAHSPTCWNQDFIDYIPRLQQAFGIV